MTSALLKEVSKLLGAIREHNVMQTSLGNCIVPSLAFDVAFRAAQSEDSELLIAARDLLAEIPDLAECDLDPAELARLKRLQNAVAAAEGSR